MSRKYLEDNVEEAAIKRIVATIQEGHRMIVACSGGKDSGVVVELCIEAAKRTGYGPIEVMFRDDEIMYPGTPEYMERLAQRKEIKMHWVVNKQGAANIYNRELPFYWCFDDELPSSQWVRSYPDYADVDKVNINLYHMINSAKYPPPAPGKYTVSVVGIRTTESPQRLFAISGLKGCRSYSVDTGNFSLYPIYDWKTGDVWKAYADHHWDYNEAYTVLNKMGVPTHQQRLSQIGMANFGAKTLQIAAHAWPKWWDRVTDRLPGIRAAGQFGDKFLFPIRHIGETWEDCFYRTCTENAPPWIVERAIMAKDKMVHHHATHSTQPFPQVTPCPSCSNGDSSSWKGLANAMYSGDPFCLKLNWLPYLEPSMFRASETRIWSKDSLDAIEKIKNA